MHTYKSHSPSTSTDSPHAALSSAWLAYFRTPEDMTNLNALLLSLNSIIRRAAESQANRYCLPNEVDDIAQDIRSRIAKNRFLLNNPGLKEWTTRSERHMDVEALVAEFTGVINRLSSWSALDRIPPHRHQHLPLNAEDSEAICDKAMRLPPPTAAQQDLPIMLGTFRCAAAEEGFGIIETEALVSYLLGASTQQTLANQLGCSQAQASKTLRRLTQITAQRCRMEGREPQALSHCR